MSNPYVSSYDEVFRKAFAGAIEQMPEDHEAAIKDIYGKISDAVLEQLENYVQNDMKSNLDGAICHAAKDVAESMLRSALAGDDAQIRNLFGFNDWYMKHAYRGSLPTQWKLIDAIVERKPELFVNEKLAQQAAEIKELQAQAERLCERINASDEARC